MAPQKLKNNTGLNEEKNLCFVNSALQLLNSINELKNLFVSKRYRKNLHDTSPISDELSRLFSLEGKVTGSAGALRHMVGQSSGKHYLYGGSQQDVCEFLEILFEELAKELSEADEYTISIMSKFWGEKEES